MVVLRPSANTVAPFALTDIAGLLTWHDLSDATTMYKDASNLVTADNDNLFKVTDKSGNGHTADLGNNYLNYKTNIQNGRSVGRCGGLAYLTITGLAADSSFTAFLVVKKATAPTASRQTVWASDTGSMLCTLSTTHATQWTWYSGIETAVGGTATNWSIMAMRVNSLASLDIYASGGTATNINPDDAMGTATNMDIGGHGSWFADCDLAESVRYDSALSATNMNLVGDYLASRWGLTWTAVS